LFAWNKTKKYDTFLYIKNDKRSADKKKRVYIYLGKSLSMFRSCNISTCKRSSLAVCHCCQKNVCISHLNEHQGIINSKLDPLVDEINALGERLQTIDVEKKVAYCRRKLEEWRAECHEKIDRLFEQKCQELDQLVAIKITQQREEISEVRSKLAKLMDQQETTRQDIDLLTSNIHYLEVVMNNIEQTCFQIIIQPLIIDDRSIIFKEKKDQEFDLSNDYPIHQTIPYPPKSWVPLASNDHHLLFHQAPNLSLVNQELTIVKQVLWSYDTIWSTCWSSTLNGFIIITKNQIYRLDETTMSIENVQTNKKENWLTCTCSDLYLFVSTNEWGSLILQYSLSLPIELIKQWQPPYSCSKDECIDSIVYNNETLAVMIRNVNEKTNRIELKFSET
jgi:hypothetical protein